MKILLDWILHFLLYLSLNRKKSVLFGWLKQQNLFPLFFHYYSMDEFVDWLEAERHGVRLHLSLLAYVYSN